MVARERLRYVLRHLEVNSIWDLSIHSSIHLSLAGGNMKEMDA